METDPNAKLILQSKFVKHHYSHWMIWLNDLTWLFSVNDKLTRVNSGWTSAKKRSFTFRNLFLHNVCVYYVDNLIVHL